MPAFDLDAYRSGRLPGEDEITARWTQAGPAHVSVICNTYNHAGLIEDALRGFLLQETTFPFEVVVHDDASTDGTSAIVAEWAARYPNIIRHVLQPANQFSQGRKPTPLAIPHAKGEFLALCEGDDFWPRRDKLQLQHDFLVENPVVAICSCSSFVLRGRSISAESCFQRVLTHRDVLAGSKQNCRTCSMMIRRSSLPAQWPPQMTKASAGDNFIRVLATLGGDIHVLPHRLSCYRVHANGVWSQLRGEQLLRRRIEDIELLSEVVSPENRLILRCRSAMLVLAKGFDRDSPVRRLRSRAGALAFLVSHPLICVRVLRAAF